MTTRDTACPSFETLVTSLDDRGIARVLLNRPQAHNALNAQLVNDLRAFVDWVVTQSRTRALVLSAIGDTFCAGGDFRWMQDAMTKDRVARIADAAPLGLLLRDLDRLCVPLIGRINGPVYGGGIGLVVVCDVAIAARHVTCQMSEVRLGLVPANVAPFIVKAIGQRNARRIMLTSAKLSADTAHELGLFSTLVDGSMLDAAVDAELGEVLRCAPGAISASKRLVDYAASHDLADGMRYAAETLADRWASPEAQEGIAAFFAKRKPAWSAER